MGVPHGSDTLIWNYGVRHGTTDGEQEVMKRWIGDLVSRAATLLVLADAAPRSNLCMTSRCSMGRNWKELKQLEADGGISLVEDRKWDYLLQVAHLMAGTDV